MKKREWDRVGEGAPYSCHARDTASAFNPCHGSTSSFRKLVYRDESLRRLLCHHVMSLSLHGKDGELFSPLFIRPRAEPRPNEEAFKRNYFEKATNLLISIIKVGDLVNVNVSWY
jgi:hypothetical protein